MNDVDSAIRDSVAALEGHHREPVGSSVHLHQLDGVRTEAMIHLEPEGVRVEWVHGKGTCAITGEGAAILAVIRGEGDPQALEGEGRLTLYGDRELLRRLPEIFAAG